MESSSRNYDVLGRELFTPDEVRKLDNKKCIIFIRGFDPIMDNKFIPFNHPMFNQTADGKGEPYVHQIRGADNLIGPPFEILSDKAVNYYEKLKDKGENVYIDSLTYEQFMVLGDAELSRRFSMQDEAERGSEESIGCRSSESNDSYLLLSGGFCGEDEFISEEALNDIA